VVVIDKTARSAIACNLNCRRGAHVVLSRDTLVAVAMSLAAMGTGAAMPAPNALRVATPQGYFELSKTNGRTAVAV